MHNKLESETMIHASGNLESVMGQVTSEFFDRLSRGEDPQIEEYAAEYPEIADLIRDTFPALKMMQEAVGDGIASAPQLADGGIGGNKRLGDFLLLHQLGSGGMGVVYEAEQISMGRHVALKILPMAGALQQKQLLRFRNEIRAAAMLDHPHIVSVYSIGEDRGVHFYAMQLIRGQSLAEVIQDLQRGRAGDGPLSGGLTGESIRQVISLSDARPSGARVSAGASADQPTEEYSPKFGATPNNEQAAAGTVADERAEPAPDTRSAVKGQISTAPNASHDHGFFRSAAKLGIQAAEALQHAHDLGVLHRDIKPGNLMLDAEAQLHITDFGLARIEADAGVTMTGDILGTLRYMSPEQALAKRVIIDQRSDIYSLGVTLYELLTLQPAFSGNDRQSLLQQIAFEEPKLPTRINRAIPRELETIVMKAIAKNPRERYATAQELADDLGRYLDDMPIQAKRPSLLRRTSKWSHRNSTFVRTAVATVAIALLIGGALLWQQRSRTLAALEQAEANLVLAKQNAAQAEANLVLSNDATERETRQRKLALANLALAEQNAARAKQNAEQAEQERIVAEENFQQTRTAVDEYFTTVSESKLLNVPEMAPLRQELLESAVKYYRGFTEKHANDPALAAELAAAHIRLSGVYQEQGSNEWTSEFAKVLDIVERLVNQGADVSTWKSLREGVLFKYVYDIRVEANAKDALRAFGLCKRAIPIWEKLVESHPDVTGFAYDLAGLHFVQSGFYEAVGNNTKAKQSLQQVIANWGRFSYDELGDGRWVYLATAHSMLGTAYLNDQEWELSLSSGERVERMLGDPKKFPQLYLYDYAIFRLGLSYGWMEQAAIALGRPQLAIQKYREGLQCFHRVLEEQRQQFGDQSPQVVKTRARLTWQLSRRADYYESQGMEEEFAEAKRKLVEVRAETLALIRNKFGNESREVAEALHSLAWYALANLGKCDEAEEAFQEAQTIYTQLIEDDPNDVDLRYGRGQVSAELAQWKNAAADFTKAAELGPEDFSNHYNSALTQLGAGDGEGYRNTCATMLGQFAETKDAQTAYFTSWSCVLADDAVDDFSLPVRLAERAGEKDPGNVSYLNNLGAVLYRAGRFEEALVRLDEAESLQSNPDAKANSSAAYTWFFLAMTHYRLGNVDEARNWYDKAAAWTTDVLAPASEDGTPKPLVAWNRRLTLELLNSEASELLASPVEAAPATGVSGEES